MYPEERGDWIGKWSEMPIKIRGTRSIKKGSSTFSLELLINPGRNEKNPRTKDVYKEEGSVHFNGDRLRRWASSEAY